MKKLLTLLFVTVLSLSAFATTTVSKIAYDDGSTSGKIFNPGDVFDVTVTYTSDKDTSVYVWVQSKNALVKNWTENKFWFAQAVSLSAGTESTTTVSVTVPSEVTEENMLQIDAYRIGVSTLNTNYWGSRLKSSSNGNVLAFGNIEEAVVPSAIEFTNLTWGTGLKSEKTNVEGALDSVIIRYKDAEAGDSICVVITAKYEGTTGPWSSTIVAEKVECPVGQDSIIYTFNVHPFNSELDLTDPNKYRVYLTNGGTTWGDRLTLADNSSSAVYGVVTQSVATSVNLVEQMEVSLYPNPTSGMVNLELETAAMLRVFDLSGKLVSSSYRSAGLHSVDLSANAPGLYLINLSSADGVKNLKLQVR